MGRSRVALQELLGREALQAHLAHKQPPPGPRLLLLLTASPLGYQENRGEGGRRRSEALTTTGAATTTDQLETATCQAQSPKKKLPCSSATKHNTEPSEISHSITAYTRLDGLGTRQHFTATCFSHLGCGNVSAVMHTQCPHGGECTASTKTEEQERKEEGSLFTAQIAMDRNGPGKTTHHNSLQQRGEHAHQGTR